jgi:hypothetical protein
VRSDEEQRGHERLVATLRDQLTPTPMSQNHLKSPTPPDWA